MTKLYFKVNFDGMNDLLRDNWGAGKFRWCYDFIASMGLTKAQGEAVVRGKLRMTQDPDGVDGVDGMLVEDDYDPGRRNSYYLDPDDLPRLSEMGFKAEEEVPRLQDLAISMIKRLQREGSPNGVTIRDLDYLLRTFPAEALERNDVYLVAGDSAYADIGLPTLDEFIEAQLKLDTKELPKPDPDCESANGLITPDGKFYPCDWMEHSWLESALFTMFPAKIATWQLISVFQSQLNKDTLGYSIAYTPAEARYNPTDRQLETLMLWCAKHKVDYMEDKDDA